MLHAIDTNALGNVHFRVWYNIAIFLMARVSQMNILTLLSILITELSKMISRLRT